MTFHAGVYTFTDDATVFCLILCHVEKKHACFIPLMLKTVWFSAAWFRFIWIFVKGVWCIGSRGKLAEISMSEVHILTMSQPALFRCSFLTHQGWDWVRQYSPCALLWLDESICSSTDFLRGCQNHHAHNLQCIRAYLDHWVIPSRGFMDRINFVETT